MTATPLASVLYQDPGPRTRRRIILFTWVSALVLVVLAAYIVYRFYALGQLDGRYWSFFARVSTWKFLGQGILGTLEISVVAGLCGALFGFLLMLAKLSSALVLRVVSTALINFTRGVPTLLFIYFFFLVLPTLGVSLPALVNISLPVAISAAGVIAELLRSGVNAVPSGQHEAAVSLGMSEHRTFFKIVLPQALRSITPALISELVIVVKDSTFAYIVSFPDLMQNSKVLISNYDALLPVYLVAAVIYILINYALNQLSTYVSRRKRRGQHKEMIWQS
ncbi:amino acid ABC transporter permease [Cutibacterium sp.]|uniref:amino acid ABC transporter permease n=1 Tax=Cutibacterium sp. TaxID=1912221 RepID=UPI0026DA72B7|nr:amino acid ABC transporter permease [Cutibacterium sp.]MDO4411488.1 amino acid ABC transporter permease [Cutibacterium sp.]